MFAIARLLDQPLSEEALVDVSAWWAAHRRLATAHPDPADLALHAGLNADRPAWAFASGYTAALRALVPALPGDLKVAFAVTEDGGNHPRAIATALEEREGRVHLAGEKSFVTLGAEAELLLVAATRGLSEQGRPRLVMVQVPADTKGLTLQTHPPTPFVPEVPHARARLADVALPPEAVLPGDGYADYIKPFRTVEDAHVATAVAAYMVRVARTADADAAVLAELLALAASAHGLCGGDPKDPESHVLLASVFSGLGRAAVNPTLWDAVEPAVRSVWERDRAILRVAEKARKARLEAALLALRR